MFAGRFMIVQTGTIALPPHILSKCSILLTATNLVPPLDPRGRGDFQQRLSGIIKTVTQQIFENSK
jgi:hypothetical protein